MPSARPRPLHFAAFALSAAGRPVEGAWQLALPRQADFDDLEHWVRLARTLERGRFDAVFLADAVAHHSPRRGGYRPFEDGFRARGHDPSVLAGAIAYVTDHLGIGFTASSLHEHPSDFARRISALDDASNGRVAWNIPADDPPSPSAEEYLEVTYKLWEGSGDEDALRGGGRVHPDQPPGRAVHGGGTAPGEPDPAAHPQSLHVVIGGTEAEAGRKAAELDERTADAARLSLYAGARITGTPSRSQTSSPAGRTPGSTESASSTPAARSRTRSSSSTSSRSCRAGA